MNRALLSLGLVLILAVTACAGPTGPTARQDASSSVAAVRPESAPATSAAASVPSESRYEQERRELLAWEAASGPAAALAELDRRIARHPAVAAVCHAIAHDLGHAALEAAHGVVADALTARDDVCGGGYIHGVIEAALGSSKHPARDLLTVCAPSQDGSCFHGVGHGLMFATGMDVDTSLALCDGAPSSHLSSRCGEGVFMQLFSADVAGGHTGGPEYSAPTLETAARTCTRTRAPYAATCWFYSPTVYLAGMPDDFVGALVWCAAAPSDLGRQLCARGVGSRTVKFHPDDLLIGAQACARGGRLTDSCLAGMGSYWSVHWRGQRPPGDVCHRLGSAALERRCLAVT